MIPWRAFLNPRDHGLLRSRVHVAETDGSKLSDLWEAVHIPKPILIERCEEDRHLFSGRNLFVPRNRSPQAKIHRRAIQSPAPSKNLGGSEIKF
jgi:hypothetical protein